MEQTVAERHRDVARDEQGTLLELEALEQGQDAGRSSERWLSEQWAQRCQRLCALTPCAPNHAQDNQRSRTASRNGKQTARDQPHHDMAAIVSAPTDCHILLLT